MTTRAVIFDMDGLLIDSEPLWRSTQVEVFRTLGLTIELGDCRETMGLRIDEVAKHWFRSQPWSGPDPDEVASLIVDRMVERVRAEGAPLPGAVSAVERCGARWPLALASSSPRRLITATLERLGLSFPTIVSAEAEPWGKPHPGVFLRTAEQLGVAPTSCLVFEDSLNGVLAAKAARMRCIAVPDPEHVADPRFAIADRILASLSALGDEHLEAS